MERRPFGAWGLPVPVIGQGTWQMEGDDRRACVESLRRGLDRGMTHVDTAELYGDGRVEEIVAEAIGHRRDELFLVSKVLPHNASAEGTIRACEGSLRRLRTDRLDLYLLHWPGEHPLEGTIAAFERLVADGKIVRWGVSNFDLPDLEAAERIAGPGRIACNQVLYHLGERAIEHAVLPWCETRRIPVVAYSPFGSGRFPRPDTPAGRTLRAIADARHATPRQVALRFLIRNPLVFAIPKSSDPAHVADNAASGDLRLTADDLVRLEAAFPLRRKPRELPTL